MRRQHEVHVRERGGRCLWTRRRVRAQDVVPLPCDQRGGDAVVDVVCLGFAGPEEVARVAGHVGAADELHAEDEAVGFGGR